MNFEHITLFIAVYKAGSFAAVAKNMNIAPSSVSRTIAQVETRLQTRLFQRTTRTLVPTQAGMHYFEKIVPLMEEMDNIHHSLENIHTELSGHLRITASVSYGQKILVNIVQGFRKQYPDITLDLLLSDSQIDIINQQIDVAIRHGSLENSSLIATKLHDVTYYLVASKDYERAMPALQHPRDICHHPIITFPYDVFKDNWHFISENNALHVAIKPTITISNANAIYECVNAHMGIALLPDWIVKDALAQGKFVELLPQWRVQNVSDNAAVWLVHPSKKFMSAKTRTFIDYTKKFTVSHSII